MKRILFLLLVLVVACSREGGAGPEAQSVDTPVMAYLSMARARHHEANIDEAGGDVPGAIAALTDLVKAPVPHPGTRIPEVEEVLADTYARMAELELTRGSDDAAGRDVNDGLAHAEDATYFRGHLLEVSGIIEETRSAKLADAGRADDAEKARKHALELLREAIGIQEKVVQQKTGEAGP